LSEFAEKIIHWQLQHGRHDLPWQNTRDPYAIWLSEIMLQQTQVSAVIPYYLRFMERFPDITTLASAEQEKVLQYWSGLGYYSRARNLHAAAQQIEAHHGGLFPTDFDSVVALPGIGRSTAAAILSFAFGQAHAILDGNVKRVLARYYGIEGWPGKPAIEKKLWSLAESLLPQQDIEPYIQGLMDLGATVCTRSKPDCDTCPLHGQCIAHRDNHTAKLPSPKPRAQLPERHTYMLLLLAGPEILLEKRSPTGIWGGLWSLPEIISPENAVENVHQRFGVETEHVGELPLLAHGFTHFRLNITPLVMRVLKPKSEVRQGSFIWLDRQEALGSAIPSPIRKLIGKVVG
jgi:A/G-specific adenine glycosylase